MSAKTKLCGKCTPMGLYECTFPQGHIGPHSWDTQRTAFDPKVHIRHFLKVTPAEYRAMKAVERAGSKVLSALMNATNCARGGGQSVKRVVAESRAAIKVFTTAQSKLAAIRKGK